MAKSWQYGRLRVVGLQVVTWLVFGASLGLAAWIDHRRSSQFDVGLGEQRTVGRLNLRLPKGWEVERPAGTPLAISAKDFDRQGRVRLTITVTQEQQTGRRRGPQYYLEELVNLPDDEYLAPAIEPMRFLGQDDAVLASFKLNTRALRRLSPEFDLPDAGLYACAVLPDGFTVTVQVSGDGAFGPSSRALLRRVADTITLTDSPSATRPGN
jgi:hypothetical protein